MIRSTLAVLLALALTACAGLSPQTITGAIQGHAQFPSLSLAVSDCLADHPDVRAEVTPAWNSLVDKWAAADDLPRGERLIVALANAPDEVREAKLDWTFIKFAVVTSEIDCGPAVESAVQNIETTFAELEAALLGNARAVYVLEWASVLRSVLIGRAGEVVRL